MITDSDARKLSDMLRNMVVQNFCIDKSGQMIFDFVNGAKFVLTPYARNGVAYNTFELVFHGKKVPDIRAEIKRSMSERDDS